MAGSEILNLSRVLRPTVAAAASVSASAVAADTAACDTPATADATGYVRPPDEQASIFFREHAGAVYRYLAGVYGRDEDAEEVTQEAFLKLHQALMAEEVILSPRAWTLTVARRLMLDRLRHEHAASMRTVTVEADVLADVRDTAPSPEDTLVTRRRLAALNHALRGLSGLERQCLLARAEGLTLREIGKVVGMDLRRVAEVVARSVRTLQGRLRD
jgi:RNA polymerase sigma factor (sigma-70 family)